MAVNLDHQLLGLFTVKELFDSGGGAANVSGSTYVNALNETHNTVSDNLVLNDDNLGNRADEVKKFTVKGSQATLVFDGGSLNEDTRIGFFSFLGAFNVYRHNW